LQLGDQMPRLIIDSLEKLQQHEKEIVGRIAQFPNGGNLFVAHPFLLLAEVGVDISDKFRIELTSQDPYLTGLSPTPYQALRATKGKQRIRFQVHGLFRRVPK
jgi:hypothetical protein